MSVKSAIFLYGALGSISLLGDSQLFMNTGLAIGPLTFGENWLTL